MLSESNGRVLDELRARASLRESVDAIQVSRLVGGVATIADNSDLDVAQVRPMLEVIADGLLT